MELRKGELIMIYLLSGVEKYKRDFKLKELTKDCSCSFTNELTDEFKNILDSKSFFGKNVVVLVIDKLGADKQLLRFCKKPVVDNDFIICANSIDKKTELYEMLKKKAVVIECEKLVNDKLINYILSAMKTLQCEITKDAIEELVVRSGYYIKKDITLYKINIFLKQLSYRSDVIEIADVEAVVPLLTDEDSRVLLKYLLEKQDQLLINLAAKLIEERKQPIMLYGLMLRNFRIALKASMYKEKTKEEISQIIGLNPYQMRALSDVFKLPVQKVEAMISLLQKATNDIKDGLMPPSVSFIWTMGKMISIRDGL
jgi:DNA polymerase III delta subunit